MFPDSWHTCGYAGCGVLHVLKKIHTHPYSLTIRRGRGMAKVVSDVRAQAQDQGWPSSSIRMSVAERERYVISPPLNETREQLRSTSFTPVTLATARTGPQRVGQRVARVRDATFTPNRLPRLLTGRGPNGDSQPLRSFSVLHSISRAIPNTPVQSQKSQLVCRWTGSLDCSTATSCHVPFHARRLDDRVRYLYPI